jgi:hypothetical protein
MQVNTQFLWELIEAKSESELLKVKNNVNMLVSHCMRAMADDNQIRAAHAMQTLGLVFQGVFAKEAFAAGGGDPVSVIFAPERKEECMSELLGAIRATIQKVDSGTVLKDLSLKLLVIMTTATYSLDANPLVGSMMADPFFDDLIQLFTGKELRENHGGMTIKLLGLLTSFKKFEETPNPFAESLANVSDDVVLSGIASVICSIFTEKNVQWTKDTELKQPKGFFTSFLGGMFNTDAEKQPFQPDVPDAGAALLTLYETVRLNANFVTLITHTSILDAPNSPNRREVVAGELQPEAESTEANLLSTFLTFASFVFTDTTNVASAAPFVKLCWSIVTCICEDPQANAFLHDDNLTVSAVLYRMEMRHRPSSLETVKSGPLVVAILELSIEFLFSHLKKDLQLDLYSHCLGVIHRVLCYQKRTQTRLAYQWQGLWAALAGLVKFIMKNMPRLNQSEALGVADQAVNICNFLMYYGDTLLSSLGCYDQMFYELIREHSTYDSLYDLAKRSSRGPTPAKAQLLVRDLGNIRSIVNHFCPRIKSWASERQIDALTPEQVLMVVRDNYDTLNLKLMDDLDQYVPYAEVHGKGTVFLAELLAEVITAVRSDVVVEVDSAIVVGVSARA